MWCEVCPGCSSERRPNTHFSSCSLPGTSTERRVHGSGWYVTPLRLSRSCGTSKHDRAVHSVCWLRDMVHCAFCLPICFTPCCSPCTQAWSGTSRSAMWSPWRPSAPTSATTCGGPSWGAPGLCSRPGGLWWSLPMRRSFDKSACCTVSFCNHAARS